MKKKIKSLILFTGLGLLTIMPYTIKATPILHYGTSRTGYVTHSAYTWTGTYANNWAEAVLHEADSQTGADRGIATSAFSSSGWAQTNTVTESFNVTFWGEHRTVGDYIRD